MPSEHHPSLVREIHIGLIRSCPWGHLIDWRPVVLACGLLWSFGTCAHPDLSHQIEDLDQRIAADPAAADLYLARGNLFRRQQDWDAAAADYQQVRQLTPNDASIDWYEGHLWLDAAQPQRAEELLTRFLAQRPGFAPVLHLRARARMSQLNYAAAAADFGAAVMASAQPGPSLFRDWSLALAAAGQWPQALLAAQAGLAVLPGEAALSGLAADLALVSEQSHVARALLDQQAKSIAALPQWRFRAGVLACLDGQAAGAAAIFRSLADSSAASRPPSAGASAPDPRVLADLAHDATPENCRAVVRGQLQPPG